MTEDGHQITCNEGSVVPEHWPSARSDAPCRAWAIHGLFALPGMLLLWIAPKRVGASLAASGWRAAVVAHVLAMALGVGMSIWAELYNPLWSTRSANSWLSGIPRSIASAAQLPWSEWVRGPFAALASWAHRSGAGGFAQVLLTVLGVEAAAVLVAVAIMPLASAGEGAARLFGRCLRMTWWSTTVMIPIGIAWLMDPMIRPTLGLPPYWHPVDYIGLSVVGLLWLFILLRSTRRYPGPAEGPAWTPCTPRCESCGYTISHLPDTTNCPECGRPVADSLPERRSPPSFARASGVVSSIRAYATTLYRAMLDRRFFAGLAVHRGYARARTFFLVTCTVNAALVFICVMETEGLFWLQRNTMLGHIAADAIASASVLFAAHVLGGGIVTVVVAGAGRRPLRPTSVATFYALSGLPLISAGVAVLVWVGIVIGTGLYHQWPAWIIDLTSSLIATIAVISVGFGLFLTQRALRLAVRDTRFANA